VKWRHILDSDKSICIDLCGNNICDEGEKELALCPEDCEPEKGLYPFECNSNSDCQCLPPLTEQPPQWGCKYGDCYVGAGRPIFPGETVGECTEDSDCECLTPPIRCSGRWYCYESKWRSNVFGVYGKCYYICDVP
jgi:hypothetical protein